ncbi:STAS domain-containing protein [Halobacteriovorax sp. GB3]|uniref:STAS domain-containing protein n=1 Tax=Halobacteriovorax sp. GB3 TaxID=2719615 RepID=UPI00235F1115|nr:STAS domain-containing protein [Halobacteriovorax sp. GB3]MDD0852680.1 STAS domain-containing protein [Halobacteriovorax sp. GB3]
MTMKARVRTDAMGNITIHMEGGLDYENTIPLRQELNSLATDNPSSTITLDLNGLDFVGSSGIGFFVETIKTLNEKKDQIKLSNVKNEFIRVFKLYDFDAMELLVNEFECDETEMLNMRFGNRRHTFQN